MTDVRHESPAGRFVQGEIPLPFIAAISRSTSSALRLCALGQQLGEAAVLAPWFAAVAAAPARPSGFNTRLRQHACQLGQPGQESLQRLHLLRWGWPAQHLVGQTQGMQRLTQGLVCLQRGDGFVRFLACKGALIPGQQPAQLGTRAVLRALGKLPMQLTGRTGQAVFQGLRQGQACDLACAQNSNLPRRYMARRGGEGQSGRDEKAPCTKGLGSQGLVIAC